MECTAADGEDQVPHDGDGDGDGGATEDVVEAEAKQVCWGTRSLERERERRGGSSACSDRHNL